MFGIVETAAHPDRSRRGVDQIEVGGMRFARVQVPLSPRTPDWLARRRLTAAAKRLRRWGVTRAVYPEGFSYAQLFERCGIRPAEALPMYRELAPELVSRAMEEKGLSSASAVIAVAGDRLSAELTRAVTALCLRNRYVQLDVPAGGEELGRSLRRSLGVPLVVTSARERLEQADVLVLFSERPTLSLGNGVVLPLYDEEKLPPLPDLKLPGGIAEQMPPGCSRTQMMAALWETGALRAEMVSSARNGCDAMGGADGYAAGREPDVTVVTSPAG